MFTEFAIFIFAIKTATSFYSNTYPLPSTFQTLFSNEPKGELVNIGVLFDSMDFHQRSLLNDLSTKVLINASEPEFRHLLISNFQEVHNWIEGEVGLKSLDYLLLFVSSTEEVSDQFIIM